MRGLILLALLTLGCAPVSYDVLGQSLELEFVPPANYTLTVAGDACALIGWAGEWTKKIPGCE